MNTSTFDAKTFIKKYTMIIALVVVFVFFTFLTGGKLTKAQNVSNLLLQNAYVLIMACGMLLCILTGGNVDFQLVQHYVFQLHLQLSHSKEDYIHFLQS